MKIIYRTQKQRASKHIAINIGIFFFETINANTFSPPLTSLCYDNANTWNGNNTPVERVCQATQSTGCSSQIRFNSRGCFARRRSAFKDLVARAMKYAWTIIEQYVL